MPRPYGDNSGAHDKLYQKEFGYERLDQIPAMIAYVDGVGA